MARWRGMGTFSRRRIAVAIAAAAGLVSATLALPQAAQAQAQAPAQAPRSDTPTQYLYASFFPSGNYCTYNQPCSLASALSQVIPGGAIYLVNSSTVGSYSGGLSITTAGTSTDSPVTIEPAPGVAGATIDAANVARILTVGSGVHLNIVGITFSDGTAVSGGNGGPGDDSDDLGGTGGPGGNGGGGESGGANYNSGILTISSSTFSNNRAGSGGSGGTGGTGYRGSNGVYYSLDGDTGGTGGAGGAGGARWIRRGHLQHRNPRRRIVHVLRQHSRLRRRRRCRQHRRQRW